MTDEITKTKKVRSAHRGAAFKLLNKITEKLSEEGETDKVWIKQQINALDQKERTLQELDDKLVDLIVDDEEISEDAIESVLIEGEKIRSDLASQKLQLEEKLQQTGQLNSSTLSEPTTSQGTWAKARLPKLEMPRFGGKLETWQEFWDSFESTIHTNESLAPVDKFKYLKGLLDGPAKMTVAGFALTSANYEEAIKALKERYGRDEAIQQNHISELMNVEPVYNENDTNRLRKFFQTCESHYRGLKALEVNENSYSCIVVPRLLERLPAPVRLTITRGQPFRLWRMNELLKQLKTEVELREDHEGLQRCSGAEPRRRQRSTANSLLSAKSQKKCVYCWGQHEEDGCQTVKDTKQRKDLLVKYNRCFKCLKRNHRAGQCRSDLNCKGCGRSHHSSICEGKSPQFDNSSKSDSFSNNNAVDNNRNSSKQFTKQ